MKHRKKALKMLSEIELATRKMTESIDGETGPENPCEDEAAAYEQACRIADLANQLKDARLGDWLACLGNIA